MQTNKLLVSLVAMFAVVAGIFLASSVAAFTFAQITEVEVNGIVYDGGTIAAFAGETLDVEVEVMGHDYRPDVRIVARLIGAGGVYESTERFDLLMDKSYRRTLNVEMPSNIDPSEQYVLELSVESERAFGDSPIGDRTEVNLQVQRGSYEVEIISVAAASEVMAGETLALDVVLKNIGRHLAEDTFVEAVIPQLGVNSRAYFGDLSFEDQSDPDKEDTAERRIYLRIPSTAQAGVYEIQLTAYNSDSVVSTVKRVVVTPSGGSMIVSSMDSQTFAVGDEATYSMTLVNAGNAIQIYQIVVDSGNGLNVRASESVVVVPAGSSKTVQLMASAQKEGDYSFNVNVHSDGNLVQTQSFMAKVEGSTLGASGAAVVLTIVLAIIFVVLVVVLIVLLTRKPDKKNEDFGESYY